MAQSFGFWRIAVSNLVAVFVVVMIAPVISLYKKGVLRLMSGEFAGEQVARFDWGRSGSKRAWG